MSYNLGPILSGSDVRYSLSPLFKGFLTKFIRNFKVFSNLQVYDKYSIGLSNNNFVENLILYLLTI